ncbi:MAG TPA: penicillin-binding protein, partial [Erythrobacter sp.]|nr:penicillin-binding protein [Erythrobacter sp.]
NSPLPGVTGGGVPARIWRDFMRGALRGAAAPAPTETPDPEGPVQPLDIENLDEIPLDQNGSTLSIEENGVRVATEIQGIPLEVTVDEGGVQVEQPRR